MDQLNNIQNLIYVIRGQRVMLDFDLARLYEVETKALNQAVKRNPKRFEGEEFMFQLTKEEWRAVKVQIIHVQSSDIKEVTDLQSQIVTAKTLCFLRNRCRYAQQRTEIRSCHTGEP